MYTVFYKNAQKHAQWKQKLTSLEIIIIGKGAIPLSEEKQEKKHYAVFSREKSNDLYKNDYYRIFLGNFLNIRVGLAETIERSVIYLT